MTSDVTDSPCLLALNAAEGLLQIVIARWEPDGVWTRLCAQSWHAPSQGAELLAPALADAFARLHITPRDIGRTAAVRGPGSFTGLRLVLATASGLARATDALCAGLDYLPLLAINALHAAVPRQQKEPFDASIGQKTYLALPPQRLWVLTHARRNLIHAQEFEGERPLSGIYVCTPEEAAGHIARSAQETHDARADALPPLVLGSGLTRNRESIADALHAALSGQAPPEPGAHAPLLLPNTFDHPSPDALLHAATRAAYSRQDLAPLYIRTADAVDNLQTIALSLGLDPKAAKKRLGELTE